MDGVSRLVDVGGLGGTARLGYAQIKDARGLREEEARPVVVVDLDTEVSSHVYYIYFQNLGKTTAHDVRLTFDPPLRASQAEQYVQNFFSHTFPTLPPGKRLQSAWDSSLAVLEDKNSLPTCYSVTVTYRDRNGKPFVDEYVLDAGVYKGRMYADKKDVEDLVRAIEKIQKTLEGWTSGLGGLRAITQPKADAEIERQEMVQRQREQHDRLSQRLTPKPEATEDS
jgi:hypothetical protein